MKRILLICCLLISYLSCTDEYKNPIPLLPVYLYLDLTFEDKELKAIGSYKEYTDKNINHELGERCGFGGVLVVHTMLDEFKAFDRTCPFEVQPNITVEVDREVLYAVCPKCGSKYDLGFGTGGLNKGVSKHGLRPYNTTLSGNKLIVKN
ncbi:MAG: (2Fe-2S)-binding protein [Tannerella sp.]|jgi:nitrite reductase/ring-hydroxylating ferredoxin subunit|nr:(2Fe-2S)-binding protein [Tannerella sp.]